MLYIRQTPTKQHRMTFLPTLVGLRHQSSGDSSSFDSKKVKGSPRGPGIESTKFRNRAIVDPEQAERNSAKDQHHCAITILEQRSKEKKFVRDENETQQRLTSSGR